MADDDGDDGDDLLELMAYMKAKDDSVYDPSAMRLKVKRKANLVLKRNPRGESALYVALLCGAPPAKVKMLLQHPQAARQKLKGDRWPLHMAIEFNPQEEVLERLLECYKDAVKEPDNDNRLPLHMILQTTPFPAHFTNLGLKVLQLYPGAAGKMVRDETMLHICLTAGAGRPARLIRAVIDARRASATVANRDGELPLHLALEKDRELEVVRMLIEAYPNALLMRMRGFGEMLLPVEYAIRRHQSSAHIEELIRGGSARHPKMAAYAQAAAKGRITRPYSAAFASMAGDEEHEDQEQDQRPQSKGYVRLRVKPLVGPSFTSEVKLDWTVRELKDNVAIDSGITADRMRLTMLQRRPANWGASKGSTDPGLGHEISKQLMDGDKLALYEQHGLQQGVIITMQERFNLLHEVLKGNLDDHIALTLLKTRPETAMEDDAHGVLPLHMGIECGASQRLLVQLFSANPTATREPMSGTTGEYPLHALLQRYPQAHSLIEEILRDVTEADWNPHGHFIPGGTLKEDVQAALPLHMAIMHGAARETIKLILERKAPVMARDPGTGYTTLECALTCHRAEELYDLIQTEMHNAKSENQAQLTHGGGNVTRGRRSAEQSQHDPSQSHRSHALHVAILNHADVGIIERICNQYPQATRERDGEGRLPIHSAAIHRAGFAVVRRLLAYDHETIHALDYSRNSPLQLAVVNEAQPGVIFEMTRVDFDGTAFAMKDSTGHTLLERAAGADASRHVIQELLDAVFHGRSASIDVIVRSAHNLPRATESQGADMYVQVIVGETERVTEARKDPRNPNWGHGREMSFDVLPEDMDLELKVMNGSRRIGWKSIRLSSLPPFRWKDCDEKLDGGGTIEVSLRFHPARKTNAPSYTETVNLLNGRWPNTKASAEICRCLKQEIRPQQEKKQICMEDMDDSDEEDNKRRLILARLASPTASSSTATTPMVSGRSGPKLSPKTGAVTPSMKSVAGSDAPTSIEAEGREQPECSVMDGCTLS